MDQRPGRTQGSRTVISLAGKRNHFSLLTLNQESKACVSDRRQAGNIDLQKNQLSLGFFLRNNYRLELRDCWCFLTDRSISSSGKTLRSNNHSIAGTSARPLARRFFWLLVYAQVLPTAAVPSPGNIPELTRCCQTKGGLTWRCNFALSALGRSSLHLGVPLMAAVALMKGEKVISLM